MKDSGIIADSKLNTVNLGGEAKVQHNNPSLQ